MKLPLPKRPNSAYNFWSAATRPALAQEKKDIGELSRLLGQMWKDLPPEQKAPYEEQQRLDKERFERETSEYEEKVQKLKDQALLDMILQSPELFVSQSPSSASGPSNLSSSSTTNVTANNQPSPSPTVSSPSQSNPNLTTPISTKPISIPKNGLRNSQYHVTRHLILIREIFFFHLYSCQKCQPLPWSQNDRHVQNVNFPPMKSKTTKSRSDAQNAEI